MNIRLPRIRMKGKAWKWSMRIVTGMMVTAVVVLLFNLASKLDWLQVLQSARAIGTPTIAFALGLAALGHLVYTSFDVLAKQYANTPLRYWQVMGIASLSYAMNLNLGVLVGGVAIRFRLYHRLGVRAATAGKVVAFSTLTNWIGYGWLAGVLFIGGSVPLPDSWDIGRVLLQLLGLGMVCAIAGYLAMCAFSRRRTWTIRRHRIELPPVKLALAQCLMAAISWSLMGAIIYLLLDQKIPYWTVLGILMFCSIAAVMAHIPGGLGVTEAIFVGALSGTLPAHQVLAGVLMYRVLYCVLPLCVAIPAYLVVEARLRRAKLPRLRADLSTAKHAAKPGR